MFSLAVSLITGGVAFGVSRYFNASVWASVLLGFGTASLHFWIRSLEVAEKLLKIDELRAGRVKREAEKKRQDQLIERPTPAEIEIFGLSIKERTIRARSRYKIESDMLLAQEFIERATESRRGGPQGRDSS